MKWATAAVATVIGCFLLGYFVVPWGREATPAPTPEPVSPPVKAASDKPSQTPPPVRLKVTDITDKKREEMQRREEELAQAARRAAESDQAAPGDDSSMSVTLEPDSAVPPGTVAEGNSDATAPANPADVAAGLPKPANEAARTAAMPPPAEPKPTRRRSIKSDPAPEIPVESIARKAEKPSSGPRRKRARQTEETKPPKRVAAQDETSSPSDLTRVRVGATPYSKAGADRIAKRLRSKGFKPAILPEGDGYVVQLGAFKDRKGADSVARQLLSSGFDPVVR